MVQPPPIILPLGTSPIVRLIKSHAYLTLYDIDNRTDEQGRLTDYFNTATVLACTH